MKNKLARNILALLLVSAMTLAFAPLAVSAASATPGGTQESAVELKVGQTGTFGALSGIEDDLDTFYWYKFQLSAASKVVITQNVPAAPIGHTNWTYVLVTTENTVNEMNKYVDGFGVIKGINLEQGFEAGNLDDSRVITRTATYYLGEGMFYLCIFCNLDRGIVGTVRIDSIEPISNTGGLTMETARTVDPAKEVVKQTRFDEEDVYGRYYYKFTLSEPAEVSIQKSVKLVPSIDDRQNYGSSLFLEGPDTDMLGTVDGEVDVSPLEIREKDDALTKTITYSLPAGTYYLYLNCFWSTVGTEYTLSFSMKEEGAPPSQPDTWAIDNVNAAILKNLVPDAIKNGGWKNPTTRLAAAEAMVMLIEASEGRTMEQIAAEKGWDLSKNQFSDTSNQAVTFLRHAGIVQGIGDNKYDPDGAYSRAATVTLLGIIAEKLYGIDVKGENPFTDVPAYAAPYVGYAAEVFGVKGVGGGLFDPDSPMVNQMTAYLSYIAYLAWSDV